MGRKTVCDRILSKCLIEDISKTFQNYGHEKQLLWNVSKTITDQTFT